jgi:hypothetical protein
VEEEKVDEVGEGTTGETDWTPAMRRGAVDVDDEESVRRERDTSGRREENDEPRN